MSLLISDTKSMVVCRQFVQPVSQCSWVVNVSRVVWAQQLQEDFGDDDREVVVLTELCGRPLYSWFVHGSKAA